MTFALFGLGNCHTIGCVVVIFLITVAHILDFFLPPTTLTIQLVMFYLLYTGRGGEGPLVLLIFPRFQVT
jgi:hypothetical protein